MRAILLLLGLFGVIGCAGSGNAQAVTPPQTPPTPGIALTPAIQDRVLGPSERSVSFSVELSNQTESPVTFSLSTNDFTALNQTGGLAFLGSDVERVTSGHGLSGILKLDTRVVTIPANSSKKVTASIDAVTKLAPGGHYAAILAQALPDGSARSGNRVAINQVVSSLVFLETAGQGTKTLSLLKPPVSGVSFTLPDSLNLAFKATGNTQTVPRGVATIDRGNTEVLRGIINENSSLLLPGSTRLLQTKLEGDRRPLLPGMYTARVQYRYDGSLGISSYEKRFLYINIQAILLAVLLLIGLMYGLYKIRLLGKKHLAKQRDTSHNFKHDTDSKQVTKITVIDTDK